MAFSAASPEFTSGASSSLFSFENLLSPMVLNIAKTGILGNFVFIVIPIFI